MTPNNPNPSPNATVLPRIDGFVDGNDLSNGRYTNNTRRLNLNSPSDSNRWDAILEWMGMRGVPIDGARFFTVPDQLGGGFGPTMVEFTQEVNTPAGPMTVTSISDAVMLFAYPDSHLYRMKQEFNLPNQDLYEHFPGTTLFRQQVGASPVGQPLPERNTPGWSLPHARYYALTAAYVPGTTENPFQTANGELYEITKIQGDANPGLFGGTQVITVWERKR